MHLGEDILTLLVGLQVCSDLDGPAAGTRQPCRPRVREEITCTERRLEPLNPPFDTRSATDREKSEMYSVTPLTFGSFKTPTAWTRVLDPKHVFFLPTQE